MPLGDINLGRYRLIRLLGSGGMGEVYLAEDTGLRRQVAIKVIQTELGPYPDLNATRNAQHLFEREMRAVSKLDHPSILPLFDYGEQEINGIRVTYMVMPFRQEGSFTMWLRQSDIPVPLPPQDVAYFIRQAAEALQHAHQRQIIHQDVKPTNFLIRSGADPRYPYLLLADFGVAKITSATASVSQNVRGTPTYMAPEQWNGLPVPATDQYALAVMAYELLTKRLPFTGAAGQIMFQHLTVLPQPPSSFSPGISPAVDAVILRALAKKPKDRFSSIIQFAETFQRAVQGIHDPTIASQANIPTVLSPRPTKGDDIHTTLLISKAEGRAGVRRKLTIQGRSVTVQIPANTHDGQIMHIEGHGKPSRNGGSPGALILTIMVDTTNRHAEQDKEPWRKPGAAIPRTLAGAASRPPLPQITPSLPLPAKRKSGACATVASIFLILFILGGVGLGLYGYVSNYHNLGAGSLPADTPTPVSPTLYINGGSTLNLNANTDCNSRVDSFGYYLSHCTITLSNDPNANGDLSWTWNANISQNASPGPMFSEAFLQPNSGGGCGPSAHPPGGTLSPGQHATVDISVCIPPNRCPGQQVNFRFDAQGTYGQSVNSVSVLWSC